MGRELSSNYSNTIYSWFADNLPETHQKFSENFQNFQSLRFLFASHKIEAQVIFHQISENFPTTSWWLYNKALINQLFVPYLKYSDLSLMYGPHFIRSVRQNCGPSTLPYEPHNWLIRA